MKRTKNIFLSFVGSNDAGKLIKQSDGAILTALTNQKFDEVILLWNQGSRKDVDFSAISNYLKKEILKRKFAIKVTLVEQKIKDVTDHNEIYSSVKTYTDQLLKTESLNYTAAISSGTPAMQVCWILLAESGDFSGSNPLNLIKVKDPKFGKSENVTVKIDTSLPKIIRLKEEVENLKKDLIPTAVFSISKPGLKIGHIEIPFSPIELTYYKYFAERVLTGKGDEKFSGIYISSNFLDRILQMHEVLYPERKASRLEDIQKEGRGLYIYTFRANISKSNKKIRETLHNQTVSKLFEISIEGGREARFYGIKAPPNKIKIEN